ncbi:hypothetical protein DPMN_177205 [Dreissena polymorpha]|uniref:Reverse transcriptase n=1 Tax=Dreissena polymorpha TaxID=45954 RepID=A0A9D4E8E4_DREPO|nr:hypothetical protein DPMN_177205 [Dreissena polymorpha]
MGPERLSPINMITIFNSTVLPKAIYGNYEKAFDRVDREPIWRLLWHYQVSEKITKIIRKSLKGCLTESLNPIINRRAAQDQRIQRHTHYSPCEALEEVDSLLYLTLEIKRKRMKTSEPASVKREQQPSIS